MNVPTDLSSRSRPHWTTYAWGFALVGLATLFNLIAWTPAAGQDTHYFALIVAVLLSALIGGVGPGLFSVALAALSAAYFSLAPRFSLGVELPSQQKRLILFFVEAVVTVLFARLVRRTREGLEVRRWAYLSAPATVAAATALKMAAFPRVADGIPFSLFYLAITFSAWMAGSMAGIVAMLLSAAAARYFFLAPARSFAVADFQDAVRLGLFGTEGCLLALLVGNMPKLRRMAAEKTRQARDYLDLILRGTEDIRAVRGLSRDVLWEWDLATDQVLRMSNLRHDLSRALPTRESFSLWLGRMQPEDSARIRAILMRAVESGREECEYVYRVQRPDGSYAQVADHAYIVRTPSWKAVRVIGRSAEFSAASLQKMETRFERMFEESPAALLVTDSEMHIVVANPAACALLRMRVGMADGIEVLPFFDIAERVAMASQFASLFRRERLSIQFEGRLIRRSGEAFSARLSATLITNFDAGAAGCFVTMEELTEDPLRLLTWRSGVHLR
jgi:PAS domain S-box-containing protein